MDTISVDRHINASPDRVWALVSDPMRLHEFSPETTGARWIGSPRSPVVGARFRGTNRNGLLWWMTTCEITTTDHDAAFAFRVTSLGLPVATWRYEIAPDGDGSLVTETWEDLRAGPMKAIGLIATGVRDRESHNRRTMALTLDAVADALA